MQHKLSLRKGILYPGGSDIGRTIVQDCITLEMFEMLAQRRSALVSRDIALEGNASRDRLDRGKVDANNEGMRGHNLKPSVQRRIVWRIVAYLGGDLTP